jgi:hypothetical protein
MASKARAVYPPLDQETRERVDTNTAAFHLSRRPKTLRRWASETGPIKPTRINRGLYWKTDDLRRLLSGEGA